jgi:hypothetical protein
VAVASVGAVLAFGTRLGPLYTLLSASVPLLSRFRVAVASLLVTQLALALLAARGAARLFDSAPARDGARRPAPEPAALAAAAVAVLATLALVLPPVRAALAEAVRALRPSIPVAAAFEIARATDADLALRTGALIVFAALVLALARFAGARRWAPWVVVGVLALDLATVTVPFLAASTGGVERAGPGPPPALAQVAAREPRFRVLPLEHDAFLSNAWITWGARSLTGQHGAVPRLWDELFGAGLLRYQRPLAALAVRYLGGTGTVSVDTAQCEPVALDGRPTSVLALKGALPRAYGVPRVTAPGDDRAVLRAMFDARYVPSTVAFASDAAAAGEYPGGARCALRWIEDAPDRITLEASAPEQAFVVVADAWFPGWGATVDGRAVPLYRVNHMVRGVAVPAGTHRLAMRYVPEGWVLATAVTRTTMLVLALAGIALLFAAARKRAALGAAGP